MKRKNQLKLKKHWTRCEKFLRKIVLLNKNNVSYETLYKFAKKNKNLRIIDHSKGEYFDYLGYIGEQCNNCNMRNCAGCEEGNERIPFTSKNGEEIRLYDLCNEDVSIADLIYEMR